MSTRLILVRHGETPSSVERRFAGSSDVDLTEEGHRMAQALARRLRQIRIDVMHVSPMRRCLQTAEHLTETTGRKPRIDDRIREVDFGAFEGFTSREVAERHGEEFQRWLQDDSHPPPDGESWTELGERVSAWWQEVAERYRDRTVLGVMHGGPILWLARHVLQAPYIAMVVLEIDPCSVTLLQSRGRLWRVRMLNDTTHIRDPLMDGVPPEEMPP